MIIGRSAATIFVIRRMRFTSNYHFAGVDKCHIRHLDLVPNVVFFFSSSLMMMMVTMFCKIVAVFLMIVACRLLLLVRSDVMRPLG